MKPGSRAEFEWAEVPYPETQQGRTESIGSPEPDRPVAVLWVPDPEQHHGWREFYIRRAEPKTGKPMGFRR